MSYIYHHVALVRVIDGDSLVLEIDLGNKITWRDSFRLSGIDAPEMSAVGGEEAKAHLEGLLGLGVCRVETFKPDKFGRWLAEIYITVRSGEMSANKLMVLDGHAVPYSGGKR